MVPSYHVITLFPEMFSALSQSGVTGRAIDRQLCRLRFWDPRDFTLDSYRTVDDRPFGGGPGMVMRVEPLDLALTAAKTVLEREGVARPRLVHLTPQGRRLDQAMVEGLALEPALVLLAGRYEGIDERLFARHPLEELSIGDYVLSGGELPAMVVLDAVIRQLPGALGHADSAREDSFAQGLLDCPHYTRPEVYLGLEVPVVLKSGDHAAIARWRLCQSLARTRRRRPDLLRGRALSGLERSLLRKLEDEFGDGPQDPSQEGTRSGGD
ncbi:MAG TPA: tRNA (guanosine(37)-N1)-methyltransferase TrmD [Thiobacillaceae bacterium]|nr:tRNA (guanosine(37)-N1)-methyltransferase TrmD [Thiobacillaceae bacterium]HNU62915.1 tRNA (guanosine(37)-N1)-methyltransferase TrmD [Thiobacillaceae bacterium]